MELQTAKRKDHDTSLNWIRLDKNKIISVIDTDGTETEIQTIEQLCEMYIPAADVSLFSTYTTNKNKKNKCSNMSKKQPQEKPKNVKRPEPPKGQTPISHANTLSEKNNDNVTLDSANKETFYNEVEVLYVLRMYNDKEVIFEMEFEDFSDLQYRKFKLSEKYPTYTFKLKTLRSVVSYADL